MYYLTCIYLNLLFSLLGYMINSSLFHLVGMVKITEGLIRKKAEHHDGLLFPLEELSLHQENIEKIEHIQNWCPKLEILLLQSNLIAKIENLNKLKHLKYLNLALNNIERVENLEKCESLEKIDLTINFIGDLQSIENLKNNYNLRELHLMGNPCADFPEYRNFVILHLPQLKYLDGKTIRHSDRIRAKHNSQDILEIIVKHEIAYKTKRYEQKSRLEKEISARSLIYNDENYDEEKLISFWNEKTEHAPETRYEMERINQLKKRHDEEPKAEKKTRNRPLFNENGIPYNINQPKLSFHLDDGDFSKYTLDLAIYKHLDTDYVKVDIQPNYVRVTIKEKIFQLHLQQEISTDKSQAQRSQTTGHLIITMPILKYEHVLKDEKNMENGNKTTEQTISCPSDVQTRRELLEIGPAPKTLDYANICTNANQKKYYEGKFITKAKEPSENFKDVPDVPPLI